MVTPQYSPGLEGVISNVTRLSYLDVDDEVILIRGYDLIDLARSLKYVDVAHLVMYGELPDESDAQALCDALMSQCELPEEAYRLLELLPKEHGGDGRPAHGHLVHGRLRGAEPADGYLA